MDNTCAHYWHLTNSIYNFDVSPANSLSTNNKQLQENYTLVCYNARVHRNINYFCIYEGITRETKTENNFHQLCFACNRIRQHTSKVRVTLCTTGLRALLVSV